LKVDGLGLMELNRTREELNPKCNSAAGLTGVCLDRFRASAAERMNRG
jgi:hypothetical protein